MRYLVDAYNVIFSGGIAPPFVRGTELRAARQKLLDTLIAFRRKTRAKIKVVFDGGEEGAHRPREERRGGVHIVFSSVDTTADDVIVADLARSSSGRTLTVVSDDRAVQRAARKARARRMGARDFLKEAVREITRVPPPTEPRAKFTGISREEADEWRRYFQLPEEHEL